jgi:DNA repair exonuclease SbcCD ATPase subunit
MKMKIGVAVLAAICVVLAIVLIVIKNQADDRQKKDADTILDLSNQVTTASGKIDDLNQVNLMLTNDLASSRQEALAFSNNFAAASGALAETKASLQTAQDQINSLDARVADLQAANQALDQHAADLTNTIASLNSQITSTEMKLVTSETNNAFLEEQLKQQVAEKTELQGKFNDLQTVRAQVKKLRDDALTARRLEWMREGIDPAKIPKGGEILMQRTAPSTNGVTNTKTQDDNYKIPPPLGPNFNLNVEVGSDGSVHVIPALPNAPAATNSP